MKTITASYNFPPEFLWGIDPGKNLSEDPGNTAFLFQLRENNVNALLLKIPWNKCEPLKGHFDEAYIESLRSFLGRVKTRGIEPVIIPDTTQIPAWQNLDPGRNDEESSGFDSFYRYLIEISIPYAKYYGIYCPRGSLFKKKTIHQALGRFTELSAYVHSISDRVKVGLVLPDEFGEKKSSGWIMKNEYDFLRTAEADFLGLRADENVYAALRSVFGSGRKPVMILSDGTVENPDQETEDLTADNLYTYWRFYQEGWPILGYFSGADLPSDQNSHNLYAVCCKNNAFRISTDMPGLSEKWLRFLKD